MERLPYARQSLETDSLQGKTPEHFLQVPEDLGGSQDPFNDRLDTLFNTRHQELITVLDEAAQAAAQPPPAPILVDGEAGGVLSGTYPNPDLKNNRVETAHIVNGAVTTDKIANGAVTRPKLGPGSVTNDRLALLTGPAIRSDRIRIIPGLANGPGQGRLPANVIPTGTDDTKLPKDGSEAMTGDLSLRTQQDNNNFLNVADIKQRDGNSFRLGHFDNNGEATLLGSFNPPAAVPAGHAGTTWYNLEAKGLKYWDGASMRSLGTKRDDDAKLPKDGSGTMTGDLNMGTQNIITRGELHFLKNGNNRHVGFRAPANIPSNQVWTLPDRDGNPDQVLSTNGSGVLVWIDNGQPVPPPQPQANPVFSVLPGPGLKDGGLLSTNPTLNVNLKPNSGLETDQGRLAIKLGNDLQFDPTGAINVVDTAPLFMDPLFLPRECAPTHKIVRPPADPVLGLPLPPSYSCVPDPDEDTTLAGQPAGAGSGALTGTYPNPGLKNNVVGPAHIRNNAVTTGKITDGAVTGPKLETLHPDVNNTGTPNYGSFSKVRVDRQGRVVAGLPLEAADIPNLPASKITSGNLSPGFFPTFHQAARTEYVKVTVDLKGRVTAGLPLEAADIPNLPASKITSGLFDQAQIPNIGAQKIVRGPANAQGQGGRLPLEVIPDNIPHTRIQNLVMPTEVTPTDNSVTEVKIADGAVTTDKIADGAFTGDKLQALLDNAIPNGANRVTYVKVRVDRKGRVRGGETIFDPIDIPSLPASKISGVLDPSRIPDIEAQKIVRGPANGQGEGRLPEDAIPDNIPASRWTTGTLPDAQLPADADFNTVLLASGVRLGSPQTPCGAATAGTLRYSSTTKEMEYCNSTSWEPLRSN